MSEILYTVPEAASLLKIKPEDLHKIIGLGLIKVLKLGRIKIRKVALDDFLERYEGFDLTNPNDIRPIIVTELYRGKGKVKE